MQAISTPLVKKCVKSKLYRIMIKSKEGRSNEWHCILRTQAQFIMMQSRRLLTVQRARGKGYLTFINSEKVECSAKIETLKRVLKTDHEVRHTL